MASAIVMLLTVAVKASRTEVHCGFGFEQPWNFGIGEEGVTLFQETRVEHVGFVHDRCLVAEC